ncbi:MFS transporter [Plantibacter sp. CFBP 8804]|uniref:MFS transporter n=1 Tax=Plantibacter sp. CFBP 8804 TaxID=2775270 RepID=UPI00177C91E1|nr:MFS transporter [Plantibacter sp. CFBP 8804]MBD8518886.1 MFS transporter [Plantibacter sp. CFBP 8804]
MTEESSPTVLSPQALGRIRRRTISTLVAGQILSGLGIGAAVSMGALLVTDVTGSEAWSGMAATMNTLGAAIFAVPLAVMARRYGRRVSLSFGAAVAALGGVAVAGSAMIGSSALVLVSLAVMGIGSALNFQARFAAADLSTEATRGRDLSVVVWSTTIGAVAGPNLTGPSEQLGSALGLPNFTGGFIIAATAQLLGALLYTVALRPDPLLLSLGTLTRPRGSTGPKARRRGGFSILRRRPDARRAVITLALSHATMVALMGMTPVHLTSHGTSLTIVGLTLSLHIAGMYAVSPVFGILTDRLGGRTVVLIGQAIFATALVLATFGLHDHTLVTTALILLGLGWSAATVAGSAMLNNSLQAEERPATQGVSDLLMNLAGAAGGALAGVVLSAIAYSGLALCLLVLAAAVVAIQIPRRPRRTVEGSK